MGRATFEISTVFSQPRSSRVDVTCCTMRAFIRPPRVSGRASITRLHSTSSKPQPSSAYFASSPTPATRTTPPLSPAQRDLLEKIIRVDQAGEVAANWIYKGQHKIFENDRETGPLIKVHPSRTWFLKNKELYADEGHAGFRKCGMRRRSTLTRLTR
jgi:hypothetical protein